MRIFTLTICLFFCGNLIIPQSLSAQKYAEDLPKTFFETASKRGLETALEKIYLSSTQDSDKLIEQKMNEVGQQPLGKLHGYELVGEKRATINYRILKYFARFEHRPVLFEFDLYNPNGTWQINQLTITEDIRKVAEPWR